jgi:hypothetical protein
MTGGQVSEPVSGPTPVGSNLDQQIFDLGESGSQL